MTLKVKQELYRL